MAYFHFNDWQIIGSSPEVMVKAERGKTGATVATLRPIAGTRPRGKTPQEDAALADDLLNDPKEVAEHIMLVDLGRNDLGRVCKSGTVKVDELMLIERYSHVMHIVSNVVGEMAIETQLGIYLKLVFQLVLLAAHPKFGRWKLFMNWKTVVAVFIRVPMAITILKVS
jgi:anthranilate synthase component 1